MVSLHTLRLIVGFGLKGFGIVWTVGDKLICSYLCERQCSYLVENSCSLLTLFVGILFIVAGYALVVMSDHKKEKLQKKLKRNLKLIKK